MKRIITLFFIGLFLGLSALAAPLKNIPVKVTQPDGKVIECFASGDEFFNYLHDADGFTLLQGPDGYYVYATKNDEGKIVPSSFIVGEVDPASVGLQPNVMISEEEYYARKYEFEKHIKQPAPPKNREMNHGLYNNLVVFIRFEGDTYHNTQFTVIDSMFNAPNYTAESMINFFHRTSYNQLDLHSYFVPEPDGETILSYEDIYPKQYYQPYDANNNPIGYTEEERAEREFALLERAIYYVEDMVPTDIDFDYNDDGKVDNVVFVVKGETGAWNSLLWPHRWSIWDRTVMMGDLQVFDFNFQLEQGGYLNVGTLCHEMSHSLSAPDLYHYNTGGSPVGPWDLMCSNTNPPQHLGAYMKYKYGHWIDEIPDITGQFGTYELEAVSWEGNRRNAYKIQTNDPNQYFVVEYRNNKHLFDKQLPGGGLVIYRIDTRFDGNAGHNGIDVFDEVYVFRPGGDVYSEGEINQAYYNQEIGRTEFHIGTDPEPFLTNGQFFIWDDQICDIGAKGDRMSFTYRPYEGEESAPGPRNFTVNVNREAHQVELSWSPVDGADSYDVYCDGIQIANQIAATSYVYPYTDADHGYHVFGVDYQTGGVMHVLSAKSQEWAILGGFETIDIDLTSPSDNGTLGGELEVSFDNPAMKTRYFTIYNGTWTTGQLYVPSGTEVTFRWLSGFDPESQGIIVKASKTNLSGQSTVFQVANPEAGVIATYTVPENQMGIMSAQNLTATSNGNDVQLVWTLPVEAEHFVVYRDGKVIENGIANHDFLDQTVMRSGAHLYQVESSNGTLQSWDPTNSVYGMVLNYYCEPPRNLQGIHNSNGVNELEWSEPLVAGCGLLAYDNNKFEQAFGSTSQKWGIKFTPEQLDQFDGQPLKYLEMFDCSAGPYTYKIYNGDKANTNTLLFTQEYEMTGSRTWVRFALDEEVVYDKTQPLWIGVQSSGVNTPIPCCDYVGEDNSCLVVAGSTWKPASFYGVYTTWMLRAYTTEVQGGGFTYRLYSGDEEAYDYQMSILMDGLSSTTVTHNSNDNLRYNVTALWNGRETDFSNPVFLGPSVEVEETAESPLVGVYPNPVKGQMTVEGKGLHRVVLYSLLGQKVLDNAVESDKASLSLEALPKGVYLMQVISETGCETRKVVKE